MAVSPAPGERLHEPDPPPSEAVQMVVLPSITVADSPSDGAGETLTLKDVCDSAPYWPSSEGVTVVVVGTICTEPASHASPAAESRPRWSVVGHRATLPSARVTSVPFGIAPRAGSPLLGIAVSVGPPLLVSGPRDSGMCESVAGGGS